MSDQFANLSTSDRVSEAVILLDQNPSLSIRKAAIIASHFIDQHLFPIWAIV